MFELHPVPQWVVDLNAGTWKGYSAYEIAVQHGFIGTEEDWLDSLKGAPGQDADDVTVNGKAAVGGNITVRGTDIPVQEGLTATVAQALNGKADSTHEHAMADIEGLAGLVADAMRKSGGIFEGNIGFSYGNGLVFSLGEQSVGDMEPPNVRLTATNTGAAGKMLRMFYTDANGNATMINLIGPDGERNFVIKSDLGVKTGAGTAGTYMDTGADYGINYYQFGHLVIARIYGKLKSTATSTNTEYQIARGLPACNVNNNTLYGFVQTDGISGTNLLTMGGGGKIVNYYNRTNSGAGHNFKGMMIYMTDD